MENTERMDPIEELLKRLSEGKLTAEEKSYLFDWIRDNRQKWALSMYDEYRRMIEDEGRALSEEKSKQILGRIHLELAKSSDRHEYTRDENTRSRSGWLRPYAVAAAAVLITLAAAWLYRLRDIGIKSGADASPLADVRNPLREVHNSGAQVIPVALPDGSSVLLHPSSRIAFPDSFGPVREVTLWGKAFFEVVKCPGSPFHVYSNEMVTKVLGTSFLINAFADNSQFSITVKTGKVAVSNSKASKPETKATEEVNLVANEQVVYDRNRRKFVAAVQLSSSITDKDLVPELSENYRFRDTPVNEILSALEKAYSIKIEADRQLLAGCSLTTALHDKPLSEKLKIICEGIGPSTTFSMTDGHVAIRTLGCNY